MALLPLPSGVLALAVLDCVDTHLCRLRALALPSLALLNFEDIYIGYFNQHCAARVVVLL